jgi:hypothetical protein
MKLKIYFTAQFIMLEIDILQSIQFKMKNCTTVEKIIMRTLKYAVHTHSCKLIVWLTEQVIQNPQRILTYARVMFLHIQ